MQTIERQATDINIWKKRQEVYYEALRLLDIECSESKEKLNIATSIHAKCSLNQKINYLSTKKKSNKRPSKDVDSYNEYLVALAEVNMKFDNTSLVRSTQMKYYYKLAYSYFQNRLEFVKKRSTEDTIFEDQPFSYTFYYETISVLGRGGNYNPDKLKDFMVGLLGCQSNPKILILRKALGIVEGEQFCLFLQQRYILNLWLLNELREGIDIPFSLDSNTQYVCDYIDCFRCLDT